VSHDEGGAIHISPKSCIKNNGVLNNKYSLLYLRVKGLKSRLLTDLIRLVGTSPSGIGCTIERAEVIAKDNKYQLVDSFTLY